jgi:hypothetical protein
LSDDDVTRLALRDGSTECECAGAQFVFSVNTVQAGLAGRGGAVVMILRERRVSQPAGGMAFADYVELDRFAPAGREPERRVLDLANETANGAALHYATLELFERAEDTVACERAA